MSFANISHTPDVELPNDPHFDCPHDTISLIEEYHQGLHSILVSKETSRKKYKPVGKIICQKDGDRHSRPEATPDELGEYVMQWIQYEIEETDDPGRYMVQVVGPPGRGQFRKSKHVDLTGDDGVPRSIQLLSEGDMIEQQGAYIGELHSQLTGMIDMILSSYKVVVNENREMMKVLSEATRKHGEIEQLRLAHQLNMKVHEDEVAAQDADAERGMQKFREGLAVFKDTNAADELIRAVATKIKGKEKADAAARAQAAAAPIPSSEPSEAQAEEKPKKKARFSKKKGAKKKSGKKKESAEEVDDEIDEDILEEGRRMVQERPLVTAAEALKMTININNQWGVIRKTLTEEQADILDDIFASATDDDVKMHAERLYKAKGILNLATLRKHLDEQQQAFVSLVMSEVNTDED
jgi:hypothetical protein